LKKIKAAETDIQFLIITKTRCYSTFYHSTINNAVFHTKLCLKWVLIHY